MRELVSNPLIILWSPGGWELIVILILVLILFSANHLPDLARGMGESIRDFKRGMPPEQRQQSRDSRPSWFFILTLIAVTVIISVLSLNIFSDEQKLVLTVVLLGWIGVGYWSLGQNSRNGDDQ